MEITLELLEKTGHDNSWKYFVSAFNAIESMRLYRHLINDCLTKRKDNFIEILQGVKSISEQESKRFPPGDYIYVDGTLVRLTFMVDCFAQAFFQTARNCFDYIAQIVVDFYCLDKPGAVHKVDFSRLVECANRNKIAREDICSFVKRIAMDKLFVYLGDYNNTVKHNFIPTVKLAMNGSTLDVSGRIPAFSKAVGENINRSYEAVDVVEKMESIHQFTMDRLIELTGLIWPDRQEE